MSSDLEELLMNNLFYSTNKKPNHVPTSFMKNSPSIKALESILNEKSKSFHLNLSSLAAIPESNKNASTSSFHTADSGSKETELSPSFNDSTVHSTLNENDVFVEDNDDTLIEEPSYNKYVQMPSVIPDDIKEDKSRKANVPVLMPRHVPLSKPAISSNKRHSMIDLVIPEEKIRQLTTPKLSKANAHTPSPLKSPHTRSNSTFSLNLRRESPGKHKRSVTMNDIAVEAKDKKKFSFKSLFKKKDKDVKPQKTEPKPVPPKVQSPTRKRELKKEKKINKLAKASEVYNSKIQLPDERVTKSFKSNTNINFIREIDDNEYDDEYDANNLFQYPAVKLTNSQYGEEMVLEPSPLPDNSLLATRPSLGVKSNNPFLAYKATESLVSPKRDLIGDSLFPKSLNPQEVESIISLERSRSMKSVKSQKRSSFINYDGSDENIIIYNTTLNSMTNSPTSNRSNSILKRTSTVNSRPNSFPSSFEKVMSVTDNIGDGDDYNDLIEFSDFIDLDNLNFDIDRSASQIVKSPKLDQQNKTVNFAKNVISPHESLNPSHDSNNLPETLLDNSILNDNELFNEFGSPLIISSSPTFSDSEEPIQPLRITPSVSQVTTPTIPQSTQQYPEITVTHQQGTIPVKHNTSPLNLNVNSPNQSNAYTGTNRPISMSFKGLRGPSFKQSPKNLRQSGSHQSFNISFDDSMVGSGFGSDDDLSDDDGYDNYYESEEEVDLAKNLEDMHREISEEFNFNGTNKNPYNSIPYNSGSSSQVTITPKSPNPVVVPAKTEGVRFSSRIILYETYDCDEYDRHPDTATCNQLTPASAQQIRRELNELKTNWYVHEESRCYTHFL